MEESVKIALILGGAQVIFGVIVLIQTIITNKNHKLKEQIKDYAKRYVFLRFVEESVCEELHRTNSEYMPKIIKQNIRSVISEKIGFKFDNIDRDAKKQIDLGLEIKGVEIESAYIKQ